MPKKRTTAMRRRAAKLAWERRRALSVSKQETHTLRANELPIASHQAPTQYASMLLNTREKTHGDYGRTASISQALKAIIREHSVHLTPEHRESLDMMAVKMARIMSGNSAAPEHWEDISGYADLIVERTPK